MFKNRLLAAASAFVLLSSPALAQTVLTANIEPATTWVRNFNPFNQTSARQTTLDFIYEPLAIFNRFDSNKWDYRLAESFELADDLKSIELQPAPDLKWSDGKPLTADDVIFTYDYLKKFPALDFIGIWKLIDRWRGCRCAHRALHPGQPDSLAADQLVAVPIVPEHSGRMLPIPSPSPTRPRSAAAR